jgi:hypothetical protein
MEKLVKYIEVSVHLSVKQKINHNEWSHTIDGEPRLSSHQHVKWYIEGEDIEKAIKSINFNEVVSFKISKTYPFI